MPLRTRRINFGLKTILLLLSMSYEPYLVNYARYSQQNYSPDAHNPNGRVSSPRYIHISKDNAQELPRMRHIHTPPTAPNGILKIHFL